MTFEISTSSETREQSAIPEQRSDESNAETPCPEVIGSDYLSDCLIRAYQQVERATQNPPGMIDEAALKEIGSLRGGTLIQKILTIYLDKTPEIITDLQEALSQASSEDVFQAAHSLKSTSATVGARSLSEISQAFETLGKHGLVREAISLFPKLQAEYEAVDAALRQKLEAVSASAEARSPRS